MNIKGCFTVYGFLSYSSFVLLKFSGFACPVKCKAYLIGVIIYFKFWHL